MLSFPKNLKVKSIYQNPLRVFLAIALLAGAGIYSGFHLPVSLYPNASKPQISVRIPFGNLTSDEFLNSYGRDLEYRLQNVVADGVGVEKLEASYGRTDVHYTIHFRWGANS